MVRVKKTDAPNVTVRGIGEFSVGDIADVDGDDAAYLVEERGDFEYVDEAGDEDPPDETPDQEDGLPDEEVRYSIETEDGDIPRADDATVDEIEAAIADIDDPDALAYLLEAERDGPDRTTAIDAIEARLNELEG